MLVPDGVEDAPLTDVPDGVEDSSVSGVLVIEGCPSEVVLASEYVTVLSDAPSPDVPVPDTPV